MNLEKPGKIKRRGEHANRAYSEIRRKILELELEPGSDLDEKSLAEVFGVSRTPLREALNRLWSEQLVVITPNRGAIVAPLTLTDFPAFIEALAFAQKRIYELAATNAVAADIAAIKKAEDAFVSCFGNNGADLAELNRSFHAAIASAAKNYHLETFYMRLLFESERLAGVCFSYQAEGRDLHLDQVIQEHRATVEAIAYGNVELSGEIGLQHAELFQSRILRYLSRNAADCF
ncbi:GntR family transcriptional regulator [Cognatishimia sp. SS12]|uniref:GntR family transcriptional regulator n=1 Tax=Cognatishimia sp. SS12 TaxID=2979465 RepID=UPI00232FBDA7|nr:GntR family transcriptional regulator [Cognatishimia sp. SS12]MDC0738071.1 GntR family transcriptional regulator [Cognatishimia sp. SS12]